MADQITVAILGAGRWGTHLLRNFLALPEVTVRAVVEPNAAQRDRIQRQFNLAAEQLFTEWQTALALPHLQAAVIATPAQTHYLLVKAALERGLHVLVEKPLTLDFQTSLALCQLAEQQGVQLVVDHTYLFHPVVEQGKAALAEAVGQRRYGYAARTNLGPVRQDVDALWDLAIHDLAIFNYWLGETPVQVSAQGQTWLQSDVTDLPHFPAGLADLVWVKLVYPSGFEATLHLCWLNADKQRRLAVVGDRATLIFDEISPTPLVVQQGYFQAGSGYQPQGLGQTVVEAIAAEPLRRVCEHFIDCVRANQPSGVSSGRVGAALVQQLTGISASLNQAGQAVAIPAIPGVYGQA
ncbi:MAG: Gfo/Idh/MocA family oxidoreductase [Leptolyngbyaceae cyanobacterium SL_1_1]|nr:Gfo/Idh/MocA family oxidoreductase [Leptolyngbyaceae cyanobacterium RM1_1_2]NJO09515.1 Gfo/Idh/MocA family oxidoreductase [Leptolyngbyaceae cyanobacterium SL_1_1]